MNKSSIYNNYRKLDNKKFKENVGIPKVLFEIILSILTDKINKLHKNSGRTPSLCTEDLLLMTLKYYREYPTFSSLGLYFGIDKSNAFRWVSRIENILNDIFENIIKIKIKCDDLNKIGEEITISEKLVDVTECIIQRPKDSELQTYYYSGKKENHTIKIQLIVDKKTRKIVSIAFDAGSIHDFLLLKTLQKI